MVNENKIQHSRSCLYTKPINESDADWATIAWSSPHNVRFMKHGSELSYLLEESFHFPSPQDVCDSIVNNVNITRIDAEITDMQRDGDLWLLNDNIYAHNVILATGHSLNLIQEEYIKEASRQFYGEVFLVELKEKLNVSLQHNFLLSPTLENNTSVIGSSSVPEISYLEDAKKEIFDQAQSFMKLSSLEQKSQKRGVRLYMKDKYPLVGPIVCSDLSLAKNPLFIHGTINDADLEFYPNLYIFNGFGGKGFTTAPYLADILSSYIINEAGLNATIESEFKACRTNRCFYKWARTK